MLYYITKSIGKLNVDEQENHFCSTYSSFQKKNLKKKIIKKMDRGLQINLLAFVY